MSEHLPITRRAAMRLLLGAAGLALAPQTAAVAITQEDIDKTEEKLSAAQAQYAAVEDQLEEIAEQFEALTQELVVTVEKIDGVNAQIANTEQQIEEKEVELADKRATLSRRIRSAYKSGRDGALSALLMATSFEELSSSIYYLDKISTNDRHLIEDVSRLKTELEEHQAALESDRAELEELKAGQQEQLGHIQAKQEEVSGILSGLSADVQKLIAKRDAEILQLAREREEQRKREEEARKAAEEAAAAAAAAAAASAASSTSGEVGAMAGNVSGTYNDGETTGSQERVIEACHSTPSPGSGLCAMWVSMVFSNAGLGYSSGNANDMFYWWTTSSDLSELKPGMIVAVPTHSHTYAGRIYGHIGIYIGDGIMMDNVGFIRTITVDEWINYYSTTVTPRWGWLAGIELT